MDGESPRALNARAPLEALLGLAWWALFAMLLWVCFLREPPRSLALTAIWFSTPHPALTATVAVLALAGTGRAALPGRGRFLGVASLAAGTLTTLWWRVGGSLS